MKFEKEITTKRLREILRTINTNVIKEINILPCTNHIPNHLDWYEVIIGNITYCINMFDIDPRYKQDGIDYFENMLEEFSYLPLKRKEYWYYGYLDKNERCLKGYNENI